MKVFVQAVLAAGVAMLPLCGIAATTLTEVRTDRGLVRGQVSDDVLSFKGIPFAAPPTGVNRWREPQPVRSWKGVLEASVYAHDCMQKPMSSDAAPLGSSPSEDCLYLNIWRPAKAPRSAKLPVMVWIYGGGFVNGGSSPAVYDGSAFAKRGVVFVSFNYRIGRFGFFAHPALTLEAGPDGMVANYGYMDQIAALQWVQRNIAAFGGDPAEVTLFGESAGGISVLAMLTSPAVKDLGLFNKAIVESGGGRDPLLPMRRMREDRPGLASAQSIGIAFAKANGITGGGADALRALRALPADKVVAGMDMMSAMNDTFVGGPVLDGKIVIGVPNEIYAERRQLAVPLMIGANSADLGLPSWKEKAQLFATFGKNKQAAQEQYDPAGNADFTSVALQVAGDTLMVEPARLIARLSSAQGSPTYEYRFSYVAESMRKEWPGAPHATEIPFVFDTLSARYGDKTSSSDRATANAALSYWVAFAKTGNPGNAGGPMWPRYNAAADEMLEFTNTEPRACADPWSRRLDLIEATHQQP
jgi:para-nitrobenzyl esterase